MKEKTKIALSLIAGLSAGAALGYFFASEKGREVRQRASAKVKDWEKDLEEGLKTQVEQVARVVQAQVRGAKEKSEAAAASLQQGAEALGHALGEGFDKAKTGLAQAAQQVRQHSEAQADSAGHAFAQGLQHADQALAEQAQRLSHMLDEEDIY